MGFESLTHTPGFELPTNAPAAPADLISLVEECHEGLSKAIVSKMVRRNKYEQIATIICQENPSKKTHPIATSEDISDYCMLCMQYEIDKSDDPGRYRVMLIGPPGRGRFERSKHIDLSDGDGEARTTTLQTEGELIEQQSQYIGELHSQIVTMCETVNSMVVPLLKENKEMMKIVSDSQRKLAEIERDRMHHDLQLKLHADDVKMEEAKEEMKNQRWKETMETIKESGAIEGFMKAILKKLNKSDDEENDDKENDNNDKKKTKQKDAKTIVSELKKDKSSAVSKAKEFKSKKKNKGDNKLNKDTEQAISNGEELSKEQLEEVFSKSALEKVKDNPTCLLAEVFKMTIDERDQWGIIEQTLTEEQFSLFKKILESTEDVEIEKLLKSLYNMKGARRLLKLEQHLDETQKGYVDKLLEIAMK